VKSVDQIVAAVLLLLSAGVTAAQTSAVTSPPPPANESRVSPLTAARAAVEDGLFDLAEKQVRQFFKSLEGGVAAPDAEIQEAFDILARSIYEQKRDAELMDLSQVLSRGARKLPDPGSAVFWRACAKLRAGSAEAAVKELADFETRHAGSASSARARRLRSRALAQAGRAAEALEEYAAYDKAFGSDTAEGVQNLVDWARGLAATNRLGEAATLFERVVTREGTPADIRLDALYGLGEVRLRSGNLAGAEESLRSVVADPRTAADRRAQAWYMLADAQAGRTNDVGQIEALRKGVLAAESPGVRQYGEYRLGMRLAQSGRVEEGIALLKAFVVAQPQNPVSGPAQLWLANVLLTNGNAQAALSEFQCYLETFASVPGQAQAYEGKGWAFLALRRHAEAGTAFTKAYGLHSEPQRRAVCLLKSGDAEFAGGQFQSAAEAYRRVVNEFPESPGVPHALFQQGLSLIHLKENPAAWEALGKLVDGYPADPLAEEGLLRSAELRAAMGQFGAAIEGFDRLMRTWTNGPAYPAALYGRGMARYSQLEFRGALADFDAVVTRFDGHPAVEQAFLKRGLCHYWLGQDDKAAELHRQFLAAYTNSALAPGARLWLGRFEFNRGRYDVAEETFLAAVVPGVTNTLADDALLWAGMAASRRKEFARASEIFAQLVKDYPESPRVPEARFAQADALTEQSKCAVAILIYDDLIAKQPRGEMAARAWGRKGDCQFALGNEDAKRYEESLQSYRVVAGHEAASQELMLQAEYKIGRCLEKLERPDDAIEQYYVKVIVRMLDDRQKGVWPTESAKVWFTRAAFRAADMLEAASAWKRAVSVLERIVEAGVPEAPAAKERIQKIRTERWWLLK
jgi:TolA-binding protein